MHLNQTAVHTVCFLLWIYIYIDIHTLFTYKITLCFIYNWASMQQTNEWHTTHCHKTDTGTTMRAPKKQIIII